MNPWTAAALIAAALIFGPAALVTGLAAAVTVWDYLRARWAPPGYRIPGDTMLVCGLVAVACCGYTAPVRNWAGFAVSFILAGTFAWLARTEWAYADELEGRR